MGAVHASRVEPEGAARGIARCPGAAFAGKSAPGSRDDLACPHAWVPYMPPCRTRRAPLGALPAVPVQPSMPPAGEPSPPKVGAGALRGRSFGTQSGQASWFDDPAGSCQGPSHCDICDAGPPCSRGAMRWPGRGRSGVFGTGSRWMSVLRSSSYRDSPILAVAVRWSENASSFDADLNHRSMNFLRFPGSGALPRYPVRLTGTAFPWMVGIHGRQCGLRQWRGGAGRAGDLGCGGDPFVDVQPWYGQCLRHRTSFSG